MKQRQYRADYISGMSACIFGASVAPEAVVWSNRHSRYPFPFHGFSIDAKRHHADEWINRQEYRRVARRVIRSLDSSGFSYFHTIARSIDRHTDVLLRSAHRLLPTLRSLSDRRLIDQYLQFMNNYSSVFGRGVETFLYEETVSELLTKSLQKKYPDVGLALNLLLKSRYKSYMTRSSLLLRAINRETQSKRREKLVAQYLRQYFFIDASYDNAPQLTRTKVLERARREFPKERSALHQKTITLSSKNTKLIKLLRYIEIIRDQRKRSCQIGLYVMFRFLEEAARRTGIPISIADRAFWHEYRSLFENTNSMRKILKRRTTATVIYVHGRPLYLNGIHIKARTRVRSAATISGTPASSGTVSGTVSIILGRKDFRRFRRGQILVTQMTRPDFLPIMKYAAAIVTDEGGLTCHAAIVSRELGIPCVVGTRVATKFLKDGDRIEVDASKGTVVVLK